MTVKWYGDDVANKTNRSVETKIRQATILVLTHAVLNAPVKTGRLQDSIDMDTSPTKGVVYANTDYAPYVELGTEKQTAQPFLRPALFENEGNIKRIFNDNKL